VRGGELCAILNSVNSRTRVGEDTQHIPVHLLKIRLRHKPFADALLIRHDHDALKLLTQKADRLGDAIEYMKIRGLGHVGARQFLVDDAVAVEEEAGFALHAEGCEAQCGGFVKMACSTAPQRMWPRVMWTSWMRAVLSEG